MKDFAPYIISQGNSILEALRRLNDLSGKATTLFVVDDAGRLTGTLTDGDVRRALISGGTLEMPVENAMHRDFRALRGDSIDVAAIRAIRALRINMVPRLNADGSIAEIYDFTRLRSILPIDAVLMAGGKGERLRPLTLNTPKPLLKVGDKAIIDYNIARLARNGITNITVTTNYLAEQIEQHFATEVEGVMVKCLKEPCRLGTIGAVKLVRNFSHDHLLVMNSDLLTSINLEDMYLSHIDSGAQLTVAVISYMVSVPYAIMRSENNRIVGLEEKPTYNYYANAGIYLFNRNLISLIPENEYFDDTDFLDRIIAEGGKINQFPINGTWIDIGSPDDFRQAGELMKHKQMLDF